MKKSFSVNDVVEITGLSMETVLELKKELENKVRSEVDPYPL